MAVIRPDTGHDLLALEDPGTGGLWRATPYVVEKNKQRAPRFSPDGRFAAYMSDESGQREVIVQSFPKPDNRWVVSVGGGEMPRWRRDGRKLFYLDPAQNLVAVPVSTGDSFVAGPARLLFAAPRTEPFVLNRCIYDVSADGTRFLVAEPMSEFRPP